MEEPHKPLSFSFPVLGSSSSILQALADELAPDTRVNCVAPGFVPTHFAEFITNNDAMVSNFPVRFKI